jgi:hypothetical protein
MKLDFSTAPGSIAVEIKGKTDVFHRSRRLLSLAADIKAHTLPKVGTPKRSAKYYVKLLLDGEIKLKTDAHRGTAVSWAENVHL